MRAVIQRVSHCKVEIEGKLYSEIQKGMLILLGIKDDDSKEDIDYLCNKILHLRIYEDEEGKMNRSILDTSGQIMIVSQFTLYGDCRKGRRPSFIKAAPPEAAAKLYDIFVQRMKERDLTIKTGIFQAEMNVILNNDGPVTILIDSEKKI